MEDNQDSLLTREIGRSMRFFLNLSCLLIITLTVFLLSLPRVLTPEGLIIALIPVIVAVLFFLAFLRLLKNLEQDAARIRNLELVTRVLREFNKSWVIRAIVGKIKTFDLTKKPD